MTKTCVWCGRWTPDRQVASIVRVGGKCEYKGETRMAYKTLKMSELRPVKEDI